MNIKLHVWRQESASAKGALETYDVPDVSPDMSFLEMLDVVNETLITTGKRPIAFDHDCREGICGSCGMMINGVAHGPQRATATCQLHMRTFQDGDEIVIEPWRARAFPVIKDLVVDRSAFDRIIQSGGYVGVNTGGAPDGNDILVGKSAADDAMDAAACIGCGACVAACPNASASLFTAAKITHLANLPQGQPERARRAVRMVQQMDLEEFGSCSLFGECQAACPKEISIDTIMRMNRDYLSAMATGQGDDRAVGCWSRLMAESTNEPPKDPYVDSETALGGADAVEKTTYVVGDGTRPEARTPHGHPPAVGKSHGGRALWVAVVVAVVIVVIYLIFVSR